MQPLFLEPAVEFAKTAAQTQLPEDPNAWPHEILQELYKQAPYVADFSPHVVMEKVDGEKGFGLGHVEVGNQTEIQSGSTQTQMSAAGVRSVRVPVVIKDGMLAPFDLLVSADSKVLPLTETRLRAAIFRPQAFDVTSRTPGDMSMIGQLYPPYRQSYGFGGSGVAMNVGMGKEGSALEHYLEKTAETAHCGECGEGTKAGCTCDCSKCEGAKTKTASFESDTEFFRSEAYLHGAEGAKHQRFGKKMACAEYTPGMLQDFIEKNAAAKGLPTVAKTVAKNTSSAKHLAVKAGVRATNLLKKMKKTGSVLEAILPTINESDLLHFKREVSDSGMQPLLFKNASAVLPAVTLLMMRPERAKFAAHFGSLVQPTVTQLRRIEDGYRLKTASSHFWQPVDEVIDRGEAVRRLGEKIVLAADLSGAATMSDQEGATEGMEGETSDAGEAMSHAAPITTPGTYHVQTPDGQDATGYVVPNLYDIDGSLVPLALFLNGTQASVQSDIVGAPAEGEQPDLPAGGGTPHGKGVFATEGPEGIEATVPLTISASMAGIEEGEPTSYRAESFSGEDVTVSLQPHLQTVMGTPDGKMLIPEHWQWIPLGEADEIALESQEDGLGKAASLRRQYASVDLVSGGGGTFSLRGPLTEKLAHDEREMLGIDDTMFLLAAYGVNQDYGVRKMAQALQGLAPVRVRVGRDIKLASDQMAEATAEAQQKLADMPHLRQWCVKEALSLGDPQSVDTVLSLGFLNPENLTTFIGYLPVLEDAQAKLCDILLASRLGSLIDTPEGAIERAVRSTEAVLEGLKALAFQNN